MNIVAADTLSIAALAEQFTAGYEGYFMPMHVDEATMRYMVERVGHRPRALTRRARGGGRVANLACAASAAGSAGSASSREAAPRRRPRADGGRAHRGAAARPLEVIEQNEPAIKLYEDLGFERKRVLEVWSLTGAAARRGRGRWTRRPLGQTRLAVAARGRVAAAGL